MNGYAEILRRNTPAAIEHTGDYRGEDGLLYCGVCGQPREMRMPPSTGDFANSVVPICCLCDEEREQREKNKQAAITARNYWKPWGVSYYSCFADDREPESDPSQKSRLFCEHFAKFSSRGVGLYFYGPTGVGKTFLAGCIANSLLDKGYGVLFTRLSKIADQRAGKLEILAEIERCALLILDDFGAERDTSYMQELAFDVIDIRCAAKKPIIYTSNITPASLFSKPNDQQIRILDRIMGSTRSIPVLGCSKRAEAAQENAAEIDSLLEGKRRAP